MSTFNFHGDITGPSNFGDHGRIEIHQGMAPAEALRLAAELVQVVRHEQRPELVGQAEALHGELSRAGEEQRPVDQGRVRRALESISLGLGVGSSGVTLAQEIGRLVGL